VRVPTVAGFTVFVRNRMGIPASVLPDDSPYLTWCLDHAINHANREFAGVCSVPGAWTEYQYLVYNLAGHFLVTAAPDQSVAISAMSWSGGIVSVTTAAINSFAPGSRIGITGASPNALNGVFVIAAVPDATHFQYYLPANPGTPIVTTNALATSQYFVDVRKGLGLNTFTVGVVSSASDQGTSAGLIVPDFFKTLTLLDLDLMKTPWGRTYLELAQLSGPNVWGLS